jgi:AraC-like DNA-binding protein
VIEFSPEFLRLVCTEEYDRILRETRPDGIFYRRMPGFEHRFIRPVLIRLLEQGLDDRKDYFNAGLHYVLLHCWQVFVSAGELTQHAAVHPAVAKVVHFIRDQKDLESSVAELADRVGLCASRLIPLFQEQMGMTITEFRNRQKLERFLDLYHHDGRFNMLGAALDAGFGSYAQFYRVFTAAMQQSPRKYFGEPEPSGAVEQG